MVVAPGQKSPVIRQKSWNLVQILFLSVGIVLLLDEAQKTWFVAQKWAYQSLNTKQIENQKNRHKLCKKTRSDLTSRTFFDRHHRLEFAKIQMWSGSENIRKITFNGLTSTDSWIRSISSSISVPTQPILVISVKNPLWIFGAKIKFWVRNFEYSGFLICCPHPW